MRWFFLITLLLVSPLLLFCQQGREGAIRGRVMSNEDRQPLVGATILVNGTVLGTTTNEAGVFLLRLPPGKYTITISMIGFLRKEVPGLEARSDAALIDIGLEPSAVQTAPVVVTASKREQSLQEVPVSVSVLDARQLSAHDAVTADDALKYVPGVNVIQSQVNIRGSTGYSHGIGTRVLLLVDGMPMLSGDTGEIIWESLPVAQIDRVEVVKGAGSALYGSSALGGVINIITRSASAQPVTRLRAYGGGYEQPVYLSWQWTQDPRRFGGIYLSHARRIGDLALIVGGSRTLDDGYKRNDFWKRWNTWAKLSYDLSPYQSLGLSFTLLDQYRGNFLYWKDLNHPLEPNDGPLNPRIASLRYNLNAEYRQFFSVGSYTTFKTGWYRSQWTDNLPTKFSPAGNSSNSDYLVGDWQMNYQFDPDNVFTAGISGTYNNVDADTIFGRHTAGGGALYVQDEIRIEDRLRFTLGGRYDLEKIQGIESFNQFNPKLGATYTMVSTTFRASVGRGFRAPSIAEIYTTTEAGGLIILPNPLLQPERSWSSEVGIAHSFTDHLAFDAAFFQNEFWDLIEPAFRSDGNVYFQNITRARITGAELAANFNLFGRIIAGEVSYTYMDPQDITAGGPLKYRPRNLLYGSLQISYDWLRMGLDYRYISRTERIDDELVSLGVVPDGDARVPIYLTDLRVGVDWKFSSLAITTTLQVRNLFQYYYTDFIGNLGPTRNYTLSLEATI